jgi:hypothetical protein
VDKLEKHEYELIEFSKTKIKRRETYVLQELEKSTAKIPLVEDIGWVSFGIEVQDGSVGI